MPDCDSWLMVHSCCVWHVCPPRLQVYYQVASEVYRDLLWEDVDVAEPVEYTYCRYTPVTTEVRCPAELVGGQAGPGWSWA